MMKDYGALKLYLAAGMSNTGTMSEHSQKDAIMLILRWLFEFVVWLQHAITSVVFFYSIKSNRQL